jgi:hypothetical protein
LASFTLNEAPVFVDVVNMNKKGGNSKSESLLVSVVTNKGQLFLFTHELADSSSGSKLKKPIKSISQLKVETKDNSAPLKIYGAFVAGGQHERLDNLDLAGEASSTDLSQLLAKFSLYIVYGSHLNPKIEKLQFSDFSESKITLKRDDPYKTSVTLQTQATKVILKIIKIAFFLTH